MNLDLVDEGDDYTLYQTSAKSVAGLLNDYKLGGNVYVAVDDDGSEVATDIYVWINAAVATTSGGGGSVSTSAVVLSAGDLTDAADMDLLSGEIAYYKASGANLTTTSEKWDLLEKAGCTDITLSGSNFTYTTPNGRTVTNSINLTRYYKVTVDGTTYYAKQNDVVKAGGNVDVAMTGIYYAINSDQPGSSDYKVANGYRVGTSDVEITSGFYLVKADALADAASGTYTNYDYIDAVAMANAIYVQDDDTITVTIKATTAVPDSAEYVFSGTGIVTKTIVLDALDLNEEVKVTLEIDPDIANNISTGSIAVAVNNLVP